MKVILYSLITVALLPGVLHAEPAVACLNDQECHVYVEDISNEAPGQTIHTFLGLDPFTMSEDSDDPWSYYVVFSKTTKQHILNAFLPCLQQFHHHSKLPFSTVADYWEKVFDVPVQIFVFCDDNGRAEEFCTSPACEKIVTASRILGLGFIWNGALGIAEDEIKLLLNVPAGQCLVTTIFLSPTDEQEVSRAQH